MCDHNLAPTHSKCICASAIQFASHLAGCSDITCLDLYLKYERDHVLCTLHGTFYSGSLSFSLCYYNRIRGDLMLVFPFACYCWGRSIESDRQQLGDQMNVRKVPNDESVSGERRNVSFNVAPAYAIADRVKCCDRFIFAKVLGVIS